jgi:signal transduction histidine kinase
MKTPSPLSRHLNPVSALLLLFLAYALSFVPLPFSHGFDRLVESRMDRLLFRFDRTDRHTDRYLVIRMPRMPVPVTRNSLDRLVTLLKVLEPLSPAAVIFDTTPPVPRGSSLEAWFRNGKLKNRFVFVAPDPSAPEIPLRGGGGEVDFSNAAFSIHQKKNLEVVRFVNRDPLPSVGWKILEILKNASPPDRTASGEIHFSFDDSALTRLSFSEFLQTPLETNGLAGKIVLVRTGLFSVFDRPFLTPVGIMRADTLVFNDIHTRLGAARGTPLSPMFRELLLAALLLFIFFAFARTPLLTALFVSLVLWEAQFLFAFGLYALEGASYPFARFAFSSLMLIAILSVLHVLKLNKAQGALKEVEQLKKTIVLQNQSLAALKKMSELGRLSSGIYHEINNPLHNLLNALKMLRQSEPSLSEKNREILDVGIRETARLRELSGNLRRFYRPLPSRIETVDVNGLMAFSLKLLKISFKTRNIRVNERFAPAPLEVRADRDKLQQVFLNLLLNAADTGFESGEVTVETKSLPGAVEIRVADNGPGIPPEAREKVFDEFYTTKGDRGSGLGLYVSREIVSSLEGEIEIRDVPDVSGACFVVRLPREIESPDPSGGAD